MSDLGGLTPEQLAALKEVTQVLGLIAEEWAQRVRAFERVYRAQLIEMDKYVRARHAEIK